MSRAASSSTAASLDGDTLAATADVLLQLMTLVRHTNLLDGDHPEVQQSARELFMAIERACPPVALNFVGAAVLRGKAAVPLDLDLYRRCQVLGGALQRYGVHQLRFHAAPPIPTLIELASAIVAAAQGKGRSRPPELAGIQFQSLVIFGDPGAKDDATVDAFVADQTRQAISETERVITRDGSRWPWRTARAPLIRLERCISINAATTMRTLDLIHGVGGRGRRVLGAAFTVYAVLTQLGADELNRRAAAHAALVLACHGFDDREGTTIEDAARASMGALAKSRLSSCDPQALRTAALVRAIERTAKGNAYQSVLPLIRIAYDMERRRTPIGRPYELSRMDLWSWLSDEVAQGRIHAGWGRAVISLLGLMPAGAHVLADQRLAAVAAAGRADDPLRPPVIVNGELRAPEGAVQPYSPLAMTPWAKDRKEPVGA